MVHGSGIQQGHHSNGGMIIFFSHLRLILSLPLSSTLLLLLLSVTTALHGWDSKPGLF